MTAYYNEIDPDAVAALRQLIAEGVIASGEVDSRSIKDVTANDLRGFTQCHFFAGGGVWSVAARLAGWPDNRPIWTGSCPCQPFSAAGQGLGTDDPRHLWPDLFRLIGAARTAGYGPPVLMGEQVSGKAGYNWFDGVRADLATQGYASRTRDIPACAVDAPHQRNRLYWIAVEHPKGERRGEGRPEHELRSRRDTVAGTDVRIQPDAQEQRRGTGLREVRAERYGAIAPNNHGGIQSDTDRDRHREDASGDSFDRSEASSQGRTEDCSVLSRRHDARNGSWWAEAEWIVSPLDGKARRTKPGIPMLVDGLIGRVAAWRLIGNAISPILAAEVIGAYLDAEQIA